MLPFGSGEAKGTILDSIRGKDLYLLVDVTNYSIEYSLCGHMNKMSPDDHYSDLKRIITAAADMIESLELTAAKRINPAVMVTHIGGLDAAAETTLNLPKIPGGKKLIYTHLSMPLTALDELRKAAEERNDDRYAALADIVDAHQGLWCPEAEEFLLANFITEE